MSIPNRPSLSIQIPYSQNDNNNSQTTTPQYPNYLQKLKDSFYFVNSEPLAESIRGYVYVVRPKIFSSLDKNYALKLFIEKPNQLLSNLPPLQQEFQLEVDRHRKLHDLISPTWQNNNNNNNNYNNSTEIQKQKSMLSYSNSSPQLDQKMQIDPPEKQSPIIKLIHSDFDTKFNAGYILSEFVKGKELFEMVHEWGENNTFTEKQAYFLTNLMIRAVVDIHSKGVSHGDISCENWMFDAENNSLRLIDYTSVLLSGDVKTISRFKSQYTPPECVKFTSRNTCPMAADIYALGVCIFIVWTGTTPFSYKSYYSSDYLTSDQYSSEEKRKIYNDIMRLEYVYKYLLDTTNTVPMISNTRKIPMALRPFIFKLISPQVDQRWDFAKLRDRWNSFYATICQ